MRLGRMVAALTAVAVGAVLWPTSPALAGPREDYETRRNQAPNVLHPPGLLGHQWSGSAPYVAGDSTVSRGEFIYQDRPFDDTGADTYPDTPQAGLQDAYPGLCETTAYFRHGEYAYPADDAYRRNGADLVELRIAADAASYYVLFQLQTLIDPTKAAGRLTINTTHEVLVSGTTATLDGVSVPAAADAGANTLEVKLPRAALPGGTWTLTAETGVPGTPTTWVDMAFVEEPIVGVYNCWQDKVQSAMFTAGTLATHAVDTTRLGGTSSDASVVRRGPMVRLHAPFFADGEGLEPEPTYNQQSTGAIYRGKLEPYATYVPASYNPSTPAPLLVLLHCLNCNHNTFHTADWPGLAQLADQLGAIVVTPLAYGEGRHYESEAELDVFEVMSDISSRYNIDSNRLLLSGMSMGSLGTFRLGMLYPDLWARTLGIGNYTTPYCVSPVAEACGAPNYTELFENARNLPWGILNGTLDELTPVTLARSYADRLTTLGYPFRFWEYAKGRHNPNLHGQTVDVSAPWFQAAHRVTHPAHVTYVVDTALFNPKFGLTYDRAYWLHDIRVATGATVGKVDAVSGRGTVITTAPVTGSGTSDAGPYTMRGLDPTLTDEAGANSLHLTLTKVASVRVDGPAAGLSGHEPLSLKVDSDAAASVSVAGFGTVNVPAGSSNLQVAPGGRVLASGDTIAATGGQSLSGFLLFALGLLALIASRRRPSALEVDRH